MLRGPAGRSFVSPRLSLLLLSLAAVAVLQGCGEKKDKPATQTAARVNKEEITVHQINYFLQQQRNVKPERVDAVSRQILDKLIDQELAVQQALELKLDRDPKVLQQLDAHRRELLARSYYERVGENVAKPSAEEVKQYYDANPALFKERRVYNLQEMSIEAGADQIKEMRARLSSAKSMNEFVEYLKQNNFKFSGNQAVRSAEQLPLAGLSAIASLKDGQSLLNPTPTGAMVVTVLASRAQPAELRQAQPAIEQFLVNERKRKRVEEDVINRRKAASVQYVGKFADAASASAAASSPSLTPVVAPEPVAATVLQPPSPAASSASSLDSSTINKGLGLK